MPFMPVESTSQNRSVQHTQASPPDDSDAPAIHFSGVGKMYKVFPNQLDTVLDVLGIGRFVPWRRSAYREFWALRGIDLELKRGERIGIIGRNGAGKSTLLKIVTGNLRPTEGLVEVNGEVHALMDASTGFHPEFTGYENIRAALTYQGLSREEMAEAEADIASFTELGDFLKQPFKTYSLGMQARLTFATATVVKPDILIVDEMLGAGDAYFVARSGERMRKMVDGGATVLLVSHDLAQVVKICDQTIWLDRGKIVDRGPTLEIIKAYEEYVRELDNRKLLSKNQRALGGRFSPEGDRSAEDLLKLAFTVDGDAGAYCDVAEVGMRRDGELAERLFVGDAQDADSRHSAHVVLGDGNEWSAPKQSDRIAYRRIRVAAAREQDTTVPATGHVVFDLEGLVEPQDCSLSIRYRAGAQTETACTIYRDTRVELTTTLPATGSEWKTLALSLGTVGPPKTEAVKATIVCGDERSSKDEGESGREERIIRRWPGTGNLTIVGVSLLGDDGKAQAVFSPGARMTLRMVVKGRESGMHEVLPVVSLHRIDGLYVSNHPTAEPLQVAFEADRPRVFELDFGQLNLGDDYYVLSAAIFKTTIAAEERYDLIDRSFEFKVVGNPAAHRNAVFRHPGHWSVLPLEASGQEKQVA